MRTGLRKTLSSLAIVAGLLCVLSTAASEAEPTRQDRIYSAVRFLQPGLTPAAARGMAEALDRARCSIPWQVTLSVAFQESSLNVRAIGDLNPATRDYGLMQVNEANVRRFRLNRKRLVTDARYAIESGCTILELIADDPRPYWIGLYRTGPAVKSPASIRIAKSYHRLVIKRAQRLGYQE